MVNWSGVNPGGYCCFKKRAWKQVHNRTSGHAVLSNTDLRQKNEI